LERGFGTGVGVERDVGGCASPVSGTTFVTGAGPEAGAAPRAGIVRETNCVLVEVEYEEPGVERRVGTTVRTTA